MSSIALLTTSKGRLHHLRQTLPLMLSQGAAETVLVDYGCPDGSGDWAQRHFPDVKLARVTDDDAFCLARARNVAAAHCRSDWLVFVDADIRIAPGWVAWMRRHLAPGHFYRAAPVDGCRVADTSGTMICPRDAFEALGGYDEMFRGWGGEDSDLYQRLTRYGAVAAHYPSEFVRAIPHADSERAGWGVLRSREQQIVLHRCYGAAKAQFTALVGKDGELAPDIRRTLMDTTERALVAWYADCARTPLAIRHVLHRNTNLWMPAGYDMSTDVTFTVHVDCEAAAAQVAHAGLAPVGR